MLCPPTSLSGRFVVKLTFVLKTVNPSVFTQNNVGFIVQVMMQVTSEITSLFISLLLEACS